MIDTAAAQWCIQPDGGVYIYADAFQREGRDLLAAIVEVLEVRNVTPP